MREASWTEGIELGRAEGIELGRIKGLALAKEETTLNMLRYGFDTEVVKDVAGVDDETLARLLKKSLRAAGQDGGEPMPGGWTEEAAAQEPLPGEWEGVSKSKGKNALDMLGCGFDPEVVKREPGVDDESLARSDKNSLRAAGQDGGDPRPGGGMGADSARVPLLSRLRGWLFGYGKKRA
jgi:hypothetical protein